MVSYMLLYPKSFQLKTECHPEFYVFAQTLLLPNYMLLRY